MLCGCIGKNGGGLAHYVGQEKLAPMESWGAMAMGKDWCPPSRLQNAPSWHYVHTDQWRYEKSFTDYHTVPEGNFEPRATPSTCRSKRCATVGCRSTRSSTSHSLDLVERSTGRRRHHRRRDRRQWTSTGSSPTRFVLRRGSRRAGELAAGLVHLARQRADVERQGPRVLPQALPRHPHQHDRRGHGRRLVSEVEWRDAPRGQDGPGGRSQLPHGHLGALLRHRVAGRDLVREGRSQLDRHAQLHSPAVQSGAAVLGVEERLADLPPSPKKFSPSWPTPHFPEPVKDIWWPSPLAHDTRPRSRSDEIKPTGRPARSRRFPARRCRR